jgi:NADH dehydrogenase (ubiquinone) Fe-S protein 4
MAPSLALTFPPLSFPEHPQIFKRGPSGTLDSCPMNLPNVGMLTEIRIYRPTKTATQSGDWHGHKWRIDWDVLSKGHRWENPLMGWQSTADAMQGTRLDFNTKQDAINFANKQGYEYFVQEPKAYASQFTHVPGKLKQVRTK